MLYLASQSQRRREILREMGISFKVVPSRYIEKMKRGVLPSKLVVRHAQGKALGALTPEKKHLVLAADTIVYCRGRIFGKPKTKKEAGQMLGILSRNPHYVYTGVALFCPKTGKLVSGYEKTRVYFRRLTEKEIQNYLDQMNPFDKAGSYAIQEGDKIVRKIVGSHSNVVGLPVKLVSSFLRRFRRGRFTAA